MGAFIDLTGKKFGKLTVLGRIPEEREPGTHIRVKWLCACDCGTNKIAVGTDLKSGHTSSCGCAHREQLAKRNTTHGLGKPSSYTVWAAMIGRCTNPNLRSFKDYGGRGIKVCERWRKFENFHVDMGERPRDTSIERIDNDGDYEPLNCRWATDMEQARNTRRTINLTHNGRTMCLVDWAKEVGIDWSTVYARIVRLGWSTSDALTVPVDTRLGPRRKK